MPRLTLCTIARDEEAFLPACLASVQGVVDEVVVVDTGSRDRTPQIARAAGARLVRRAWDDDFSAARNAAIEPVREGFVLVLDADERLAPGSGAVLRRAIESDALDCGVLALHDADALEARPEEVLSGARRLSSPVLLGRLLRRTSDLRWEGVVHEHLTAWALAHPRRVELDAAIVHYGAVPELRAARQKSGRNLRLLEKRCREDAGNPMAHAYLAQELLRADEAGRALEASRTAWALVRRLGAGEGVATGIVSVAGTHAFLLLREGRIEDAERVVASALERAGEHPNLLLLRGVAAERRWLRDARDDPGSPLLDAAARAFRRCLELDGRAWSAEVLPGTTSWVGATRLGTTLLCQARAAEALEAFDRALALRPRHLDARLGRAEALHASGRSAQALDELTPLLHPALPDGWILASAAGCAAEGYAAIAPIAAQARRALATREPLAPHRLRLLEAVEAQAHAA